jgi:hypothetical protein
MKILSPGNEGQKYRRTLTEVKASVRLVAKKYNRFGWIKQVVVSMNLIGSDMKAAQRACAEPAPVFLPKESG